ncbi:iron-containing alcohol dehydrogenase [Verticiella sediminum]|uniref:Iron-containing alcohol dehydrogenase n=1 Tax=Verticiella sediminum TaxID=1247510 RepID=A0A556AZF3_9BURK|nr:iron-containing alcohol dehydrogenase [Verticiella sediminum]TSH98322.1 iron-containing alcohol dehydrogenase [Verticiella sediminum]
MLHLPLVHFGFGSAAVLRHVLADVGVRQPLFITDAGVRGSGGLDYVLKAFGDSRVPIFDAVGEPPTFAAVDAAAGTYRAARCDGIVAVGGGSVIDTAKMASVLASQGGSTADYAGAAERITKPAAPLVVLPSTSGSGSEVSPSTGIHPAAGEPGVRTRAPRLMPVATICDPELTLTMPPRLTASAGLDALTHCIEGYLSPAGNPVVDSIALGGITRIAAHLERAVADGADRQAREAMMLGALEGGISIGKGLGPAHALATVFSHWPVAHGTLAALSLPPSLDLMERHVPGRMAAVAQALGLPAGQSANGFRSLLERLHERCGIPLTLRAAGCTDGDPAALARAAEASAVNLTSPYRPSIQEYEDMVSRIIG